MRKEEIFKVVEKQANGTVLSFPDRGPWGSSKYRGNFSGYIPAALIYRYGAKSVSEIFAGGGTTSDLCKDLEIPYCGIDLNPSPVRNDIVSMDILDASAELPDAFYTADLQILHPPYPCIQNLHYAGSMWKDTNNLKSRDIQEMDWESGMNAINKALLRGYAAMPNGAYQAVVVGDVRRKVKGQSIFKSMLADLAIPGNLEQVLVKMQHNTVSGRNSSYGNGRGRKFFLIEHEFIVIIKKPSGYEIAYLVPKKYACDIRDSVSSATWKDVVFSVLRKLGKEADLANIYAEVEGHKKAQANPHWKDKVRQTLQKLEKSGVAVNVNRGVWALAA
jgi:hypothetical protein